MKPKEPWFDRCRIKALAMNFDYEKQLEAAIDRELKQLREMKAPAGFSARVMASLSREQVAPWYRQSWQCWPLAVRVAVVVFLAGFFGTLCFGVWKLPDTQMFADISHALAQKLSGVASVWNACNSVVSVLALSIKKLGNGFIFGCLGAMALAWSMFLGVGGAVLRMAFARR